LPQRKAILITPSQKNAAPARQTAPRRKGGRKPHNHRKEKKRDREKKKLPFHPNAALLNGKYGLKRNDNTGKRSGNLHLCHNERLLARERSHEGGRNEEEPLRKR